MQFVEANPGDPFPRYGVAMELANSGRLDEAERVFAELISKFPDYTPAYLHAGGVLVQGGKKDEASELYRAGIAACGRRRPPDSHAQGELQSALAALKNPDVVDDDDDDDDDVRDENPKTR